MVAIANQLLLGILMSVFAVYDDDTFSVDDFHVEHDDFIALFAAGNDGSEGYYSLGEPSVSKNALCIGATMSSASSDIESMAFFSSMGPTFDNRLKVILIQSIRQYGLQFDITA